LRILVTGGTGFIGGHVARRLVASGHDVTILSRDRALPEGTPGRVRVCRGELTDLESMRIACTSQDAVVHAAGLVGAGGTWSEYRRTNVIGTRLLIRAAIASGVSRLVHLSSLVVHAEPGRGEVIRETSPLLRTIAGWNHYARSKLLSEHIVRRTGMGGRLATVVLRPGLVLGPRDRWTTPWILLRLSRRFPLMIGDGRNVIPCVAVEDLADAVVRAVAQTSSGADVFNVAAARGMTQQDLLASHARAIGRSLAPVGLPAAAMRALATILDALDHARAARPSLTHRMAVAIAGVDAHIDCSHAATGLGWRGSGSCEDAIHRAVEWELARREGPLSGPSRYRSEMAT
jgi:nucleoside-diphosphate-sugar epimerase